MTQRSATSTAEAWSVFWAEQDQGSRCMARSPELCELLDAHWRNFASRLSTVTRVIDLGCGAGSVGRALHTVQPHLRVTGVDVAQVPPSNERGLELQSNIPMESLPFPDGTFGAAVSQFGFEYGDHNSAAKEMARVLAPDAPFSLLIHHPQSPVVADLRRHRRAIEELCGLRVQAAFFSGNANALSERFAILKRECSGDPLVEHAERGLQTHIRQDENGRLQIWRAIADALVPELVMLDSLDLCCADEQDIPDHVEPLTEWFDVRLPTILRTRSGDPIAWEIHGNRLS